MLYWCRLATAWQVSAPHAPRAAAAAVLLAPGNRYRPPDAHPVPAAAAAYQAALQLTAVNPHRQPTPAAMAGMTLMQQMVGIV